MLAACDPEPCDNRRPANTLPAIEGTMKQARIMPCGKCSPPGLKVGVHRHKKVYTLLSNNDCKLGSCAASYPEPCDSSRPASALPAIEDTMKQANIMQCSKCSPSGLSAGVHRNTKVYMLPSNRDCIAPSKPTLGSAAYKLKSRTASKLGGVHDSSPSCAVQKWSAHHKQLAANAFTLRDHLL